jgi:pyruvate/2-oxoacid:ferredoxin oxidoreductase beta subunit
MSLTRIVCQGCGFVQVFCNCKDIHQLKEKKMSEQGMSDVEVKNRWESLWPIETEHNKIAMNELDHQLERDHKRARANEKRLEERIDKLCKSIDERGANEARLAKECVKLQAENKKLKARVKELEG